MTISTYSLLRLHPYPQRSEHLNIGVVVFRGDGVRVHLADNLKKVRAFAPQVDLEILRGWPDELQERLAQCQSPEQAKEKLALWGSMQQLSEQTGHFTYHNDRDYALRVAGVLSRMVDPVQKRAQPGALPKTRLELELKNTFSTYGWLSASPDDVDHCVAHRHVLDPNTGLRADFAVRNGKLNIIEAVDFRVANPLDKREAAQAKALVLALRPDAVRYAVVSGGDGKESLPAIRLLESLATLVRWEDAAGVNAFLEKISKATNKPMLTLPTG